MKVCVALSVDGIDDIMLDKKKPPIACVLLLMLLLLVRYNMSSAGLWVKDRLLLIIGQWIG
jgi:hypothetical protein